jgi:hypothetical protein
MSFVASRDALSSSHLWNSRPPAVDRMVFFAVAMFLPCLSFSHLGARIFILVSVGVTVCIVVWSILVTWLVEDGRHIMSKYKPT